MPASSRTEPIVSVVLATYNRAATLERAIRSVLAQTMEQLELIVVDDGSTDDTYTLLHQIEDTRLRVLRNPEPGGAGAARNRGAAEARGKFLAFQDSDDEWLTGKLEQQLKLAEDESVGLVCCGYLTIPLAGNVWMVTDKPWMRNQEWDVSRLLDFQYIAPTWLIRRSIFEQGGGFDHSLPNLEDWEFALRLFELTRIRVASEPLVVKHGAADGLNKNRTYRVRSLRIMLDKHSTALANYPRIRGALFAELGKALMGEGDFGAGRSCLCKALSAYPNNPVVWVHYLASMAGGNIYRMLKSKFS